MNVRRAVLLSSTALVSALLVPGAGLGPAQAASTQLRAAYTCKINFWLLPDAEPFPMEVNADVEAVRSGPRVNLALNMGRPVLPLEDPLDDVSLSSTLKATANGTSTTLSGSGTVSLRPQTPVDLPVLKSTLTTPETSVKVSPGALTVTVKAAGFTVPINCTLDAPVTVTVPVTDPSTPTPTPTPTPITKQAPVLKVSLTKKTQQFRKAPAQVKVSLKRAKQSTVSPRGTVVVKVGKRTVARVKVTGPKSFRVLLPRNVKVGNHTVKVVFTPAKGTPAKKVSRSATLRVKR